MFEKIKENINRSFNIVLDEFYVNSPSSLVEADFEVYEMKICLAYNNHQLDDKEWYILMGLLTRVRRLWKKLNDVK